MAIFECNVRGTDEKRLVKAATSAQARDHIVSAKAISAERMADVMATGVKLEIAAPSITSDDTLNERAREGTDPKDHAPGGKLHKDTTKPKPEDEGDAK